MDNDSVFFAGNDLSTIVKSNLIDHNFIDLPRRELKMYKLARSNKSVLTSAEYSSKEATVNFHLRGCDREETEEVLANLKSYLRPANAQLLVLIGGVETQFDNATMSEIGYRWYSNKIILTITFTIADPIGYEDVQTVLVNTTVTNATSSNAINNLGSFDALPVVNLTVTAVTGGTSQSLSVTNEETGQGITITRTWANGDTVEIDSATKTVVINGATSDFTGQFPVFPPGAGSLGYSDTFTTRSVDLSAVYKKRYL